MRRITALAVLLGLAAPALAATPGPTSSPDTTHPTLTAPVSGPNRTATPPRTVPAPPAVPTRRPRSVVPEVVAPAAK